MNDGMATKSFRHVSTATGASGNLCWVSLQYLSMAEKGLAEVITNYDAATIADRLQVCCFRRIVLVVALIAPIQDIAQS